MSADLDGMPLSYIQDMRFKVNQFLRFTQTKDFFKNAATNLMICKTFTYLSIHDTYVRRNHRSADRGHVKFPKHSWSICQSFVKWLDECAWFCSSKFENSSTSVLSQ